MLSTFGTWRCAVCRPEEESLCTYVSTAQTISSDWCWWTPRARNSATARKSIQVPTLMFWQREDRVVPLEQGERLHSAIAGSRLEVFEGNAAGIDPHDWHWAHALNPERFNELASAFLASDG